MKTCRAAWNFSNWHSLTFKNIDQFKGSDGETYHGPDQPRLPCLSLPPLLDSHPELLLTLSLPSFIHRTDQSPEFPSSSKVYQESTGRSEINIPLSWVELTPLSAVDWVHWGPPLIVVDQIGQPRHTSPSFGRGEPGDGALGQINMKVIVPK